MRSSRNEMANICFNNRENSSFVDHKERTAGADDHFSTHLRLRLCSGRKPLRSELISQCGRDSTALHDFCIRRKGPASCERSSGSGESGAPAADTRGLSSAGDQQTHTHANASAVGFFILIYRRPDRLWAGGALAFGCAERGSH